MERACANRGRKHCGGSSTLPRKSRRPYPKVGLSTLIGVAPSVYAQPVQSLAGRQPPYELPTNRTEPTVTSQKPAGTKPVARRGGGVAFLVAER
jgi:hypothetical protein